MNKRNLIAKFVTNQPNVGDSVLYKIFVSENEQKAKEDAQIWFNDRFDEKHLKTIEIIKPVNY